MRSSFQVLLALALGLSTSLASAQGPNQNFEQEAQTPARTEQTQAQAAQSAAEASKLEASEADMSITYDQILAKPDDVELNYRYARAQIARGELKSAAATLERVLLVNPDLAKVRLLYAVVLLRLDNLIEAQQELETLKALPMPDSLRQEIDLYLSMIKKARKRTHLFGALSFGIENDDNRNATPSNDTMLFFNAPVTLTGPTAMRHDDASTLYLASVGLLHDLGYQEGHTIFANYSYYRAEQASVKNLNLQAHSVNGGGTYKSSWVNVTPSIVFDHIVLAQTTFMRDWGGRVRFDKQINRNFSVYMDYKDVEQQYQPTVIVPTGPQRDGAEMDFLWGGDYVLSPTMKLGAAYGYTIKNANLESLSYNRNLIMLTHQWLLPKGMFLFTSLAFNYDQYDQPDFTVSPLFRRDIWGRVSINYGIPLALAHPALKDFLATVSYEYFEANSTIMNYSYTNNKEMLMLTYRWDAAF